MTLTQAITELDELMETVREEVDEQDWLVFVGYMLGSAARESE